METQTANTSSTHYHLGKPRMDKKTKQKSNTTQQTSEREPQPQNNKKIQRLKTGMSMIQSRATA